MSDDATRPARWFVIGLLVLMLVPGAIGFDLWPLTGWRLFSLSRDDTQDVWVLEAVVRDNITAEVDLQDPQRVSVDFEDLPLAYRHVAWILDDLPDAPLTRQTEVCHALLKAVRAKLPGTVFLRLGRDTQRLVVSDSYTGTLHDPVWVGICNTESGAFGPDSGLHVG